MKIVEATGKVYPEAEHFISDVRREIEQAREREHERRSRMEAAGAHLPSKGLKSIDSFRADPRYGGDGTRIDLAYAIYAASHGATEVEIEAAIRSRDLSHKGGERRQADYVERTIRKGFKNARNQSRGR